MGAVKSVKDLETSNAHKRVMTAIRAAGFRKFGSYLAAHTIKSDGSTWSLGDMASELDIPTSAFVSYHTAWIQLKKDGLV